MFFVPILVFSRGITYVICMAVLSCYSNSKRTTIQIFSREKKIESVRVKRFTFGSLNIPVDNKREICQKMLPVEWNWHNGKWYVMLNCDPRSLFRDTLLNESRCFADTIFSYYSQPLRSFTMSLNLKPTLLFISNTDCPHLNFVSRVSFGMSKTQYLCYSMYNSLCSIRVKYCCRFRFV